MEDVPDLKDLQPDRWIYLDRDRYCCECSKTIEAGKKALEFPSTKNIYCYKCAKVLTGKVEERRYRRSEREYMPPVGGE